MKLFTLLYGKAKSRMKPIMTDDRRKCENYMHARGNVKGHHQIVEAEADASVWRKKSATVGGNRCESVQRHGHGPSGYISKHGFQPHT